MIKSAILLVLLVYLLIMAVIICIITIICMRVVNDIKGDVVYGKRTKDIHRNNLNHQRNGNL